MKRQTAKIEHSHAFCDGAGSGSSSSGEIWHVRCDPLAHRPALFDVFLQNAPKLVGIEVAVPDSFWINNQPGPTLANAQAGCFRSKHRHGKPARLCLEQVPHCATFRRIAAVRSGAQKEVPSRSRDLFTRNFRVGREAIRRAHRGADANPSGARAGGRSGVPMERSHSLEHRGDRFARAGVRYAEGF